MPGRQNYVDNHEIDTKHFLPIETLVISREVVGEGRLGMDTTSRPDEFVKTVFSPAVYSTNLMEELELLLGLLLLSNKPVRV